MKVQIEFELPDETIAKAARQSAMQLFTSPEYSSKAGPGYALVADAAMVAVAAIDWEPIVKSEIDRITPDVVNDVVGAALKAMVKAQVKALKESGKLLQ